MFSSLKIQFCINYRPLKEGVRKIDTNSNLVSPCDGTVLHFGTVQTGKIEQVLIFIYLCANTEN